MKHRLWPTVVLTLPVALRGSKSTGGRNAGRRKTLGEHPIRLEQPVIWFLSITVILAASAWAHAAEPPQHPGRIIGTVVHADTGVPISGAYVGIGDFGDAGGSNLERFRQQGNYATSKTAENGHFELTGVALGEHPLVVTHGEFVRCDKRVVARHDPAEADLPIKMSPAGKIEFTMVDAEDKHLERQVRVCLEASTELLSLQWWPRSWTARSMF